MKTAGSNRNCKTAILEQVIQPGLMAGLFYWVERTWFLC